MGTPSAEVSGLWGLIGLVIAVIVAPLLFNWLNTRTTKKTTGTTLTRIEENTKGTSNGFPADVISKLGELQRVVTEVHDKLDGVVSEQAYQRGRFDQHVEECKRPPPA